MAVSSTSPNAYIFLGPELGKKQDEVDAIKQKLTNAETTVFYAGETPASTITDTIQNSSLFSEKLLIIIKNAEVIKKKDDVELLVSCINNLDPNTTIILLSDEIKLAAAIDDAVPKNNRKIFYELFEREKNEWLKQFFKREGFNIEKDCIAVILEMVENNTEALKRECSRLVHFLPKNKEQGESQVKIEDVEKWLSHNREESAFTLFSRIAAGDLSKALESLSVMLAAKESSQSILAGLAWCFRKLGDYLSLLETGGADNSFELKKIGLSSPKARDDYSAAARRYNAESAEVCLALTAEYDNLLRSPVGVMERVLMDRYIYNVMKSSKN
jgi:DNA polymerase-3 subunit delta